MISLVFWILAAACNAVMDTLAQHWGGSVFFKFGNRTSWWGDAQFTWIRKYEGPYGTSTLQLPKRRKWFWRVNYPTQLTDSWHFFKMLMIWFECAALGIAIIYPPQFLNILDCKILQFVAYFVIAGILWNITFPLFYNKLLLLKTWKKQNTTNQL